MIQGVVALLFFGALVAPIAIMALAVSKNWNLIRRALMGEGAIKPVEFETSIRTRTRPRVSRPSPRLPAQPMRAAA